MLFYFCHIQHSNVIDNLFKLQKKIVKKIVKKIMSGSDSRHAVSHILVAGSTLWCIYNTSKTGEWKWIYGTYGTLCFYSFVGVWRYGTTPFINILTMLKCS